MDRGQGESTHLCELVDPHGWRPSMCTIARRCWLARAFSTLSSATSRSTPCRRHSTRWLRGLTPHLSTCGTTLAAWITTGPGRRCSCDSVARRHRPPASVRRTTDTSPGWLIDWSYGPAAGLYSCSTASPADGAPHPPRPQHAAHSTPHRDRPVAHSHTRVLAEAAIDLRAAGVTHTDLRVMDAAALEFSDGGFDLLTAAFAPLLPARPGTCGRRVPRRAAARRVSSRRRPGEGRTSGGASRTTSSRLPERR